MFIGDHFVGSDIHFSLQNGEYWKKTLGPVFIYLNSNSNQNHSGGARDHLWDNAKAQVNSCAILIFNYNKFEKITKLPMHEKYSIFLTDAKRG